MVINLNVQSDSLGVVNKFAVFVELNFERVTFSLEVGATVSFKTP